MPGRSRPLIAALILALWAVPAGAAEFMGAWVWARDVPTHGGYSGLELSADGATFTTISDRTRVVTGRLLRDAGRITGIEIKQDLSLLSARGAPMNGPGGDAEGLAIGADSGFYVSFETRARVWRYDAVQAAGTPLPRHPAFRELPNNGALEALAIGPDQTLYVLPETTDENGVFPVWRFSDGDWTQIAALPARDFFAVVGADFDERGRLYLLERGFVGVGFRSRIRRITFDGTMVDGDETLLTTNIRQFDNLEGISIWRDPGGALRATMISDDNFNWYQRTEFVEYRLPD